MTKAWEAKNPEKNNAQRQKKYHALHPEVHEAYYEANKDAYSERARQRLWQWKIAAINHLGGACVVCGLKDMRVLQINHVNGGGGKEGKFGMEMYPAIVKGERTSDDLDVRCANHNILYEYEAGRRALPRDLDLTAYTLEETTAALRRSDDDADAEE